MMKKRLCFGVWWCLLTLIALLAVSCSDNYYEIVSRPDDDPAVLTPWVTSFGSRAGISVSWPRDTLTDDFILYRESLPSVGAYEVVYYGEDTKFFDSTATPGAMYRYWLCKRRGGLVFENREKYACAAYDGTYIRDLADARDTIAEAHEYTTFEVVDYVVYYNQAVSTNVGSENNVIMDVDWYYSDLPPHTQKTIAIEFADVYEGAAGGTDDERLYVKTEMVNSLTSGLEFSLYNAENEVKRVYFCISPDPSAFTQYSPGLPGARKMWWYKLHFKEIQVYTDSQSE